MEEPNEIDEYIPNGVDNGEEYSSDEDEPDGISGEDPLKYLDLDSTRNKRKELPTENGTVFVGIKEANDNETSLNKPKDEKDHETVEKDEKLSSPTAQPKTEQLYSELIEKLEAAKHSTTEAIRVCEKVFLLVKSNDDPNNYEQHWFEYVVGPLVSAPDLFDNSIKNFQEYVTFSGLQDEKRKEFMERKEGLASSKVEVWRVKKFQVSKVQTDNQNGKRDDLDIKLEPETCMKEEEFEEDYFNMSYPSDEESNDVPMVKEEMELENEFKDELDNSVGSSNDSSVSNRKRKGFPKGRKSTCRLCNQTFPSNAMLAKHKVNIHKMENPYECETCLRAFNNQSNYRRHIISHLPLVFNCDICFLKFPTISKVATHKKKVHGIEQPVHWRDRRAAQESQPTVQDNDSVQDPSEKVYPCGLCDLTFTSKKVKKTHKLDIHGVQEFEQHKCGTCDKVFQHKRTMRRHMQTCQAEKTFPCDLCGEGYTSPYLLKVHKNKDHFNSKPYSCDFCGKAFNQKSCLRNHIRTHTGEKPFICNFCGKGFAQQNQLSTHIRKHTGERPYSCDICGKAFTDWTPMNYHKMTHTGEKPFSCEQCGKAFRASGDLTIHKRTHTGEKPFSCDLCNKSFYSNSELSKHNKTSSHQNMLNCMKTEINCDSSDK